MKAKLRCQVLIFTRSLGMLSALMPLFMGLNALLWYLLTVNLNNLKKPLVFVNESLRIAGLLFVFFLFISYEMAAKLKRTDAIERLSATKGELLRLYASHFCVLLVPVLIVCANIFLWFFTALNVQELRSNQGVIHLCKAIMLYCFLPSCIAILIGVLLSKIQRAGAYTLIVTAVFLTSFIPLNLFSDQQIGGFSIASVLDWFSLSVPDADWLPDSVYGIPMETARWVKALFWIFLFVLLIIYQNISNVRRKMRITLFILVAATLATGVRFACRGKDSILYKDNRRDGLQLDLYNYYKDKLLPEEKQTPFEVDSYEMNLNIRNNLRAKVKMIISNRSSNDPLIFTLHHGLKVESVSDIQGNLLNYSRDIDYLTIDTDKTEIVVSYSGNLGKYYANNQAVFLPGYAAYYPVPGIYHLWTDSNNTIKPVISTSVSQFDIKVDTPLEVFSNLRQISGNAFSGESNSVGVFAGLLKKTEKENVTYLESLMLNDSSHWTVSDYNEKWNKLYECFELSENKPLEGRMIVFLPGTILGFSCPSKYVGDGDIIYFGDMTPRPDTLAYETLISDVQKTPQNFYLYSSFVNRIYSGLDKRANGINEKPDYDNLLLFKKASYELTEEDMQSFGQDMMYWEQLLSFQEEKLGSRIFLNNIYRYLQDPNPKQDVLDFVYFMGEERNDGTD